MTEAIATLEMQIFRLSVPLSQKPSAFQNHAHPPPIDHHTYQQSYLLAISLSTIMPISHHANQQSCPLAIMSIGYHAHWLPCPLVIMLFGYQAHQLSSPSAIMTISNQAHQLSCPSTIMHIIHHTHCKLFSLFSMQERK